MAISAYYAGLRGKLGHDLLMIPCVAAVIHDQHGRVLIQHRTDDGCSLPAGAIEPGETPGEAIVREVLEETGLQVRPRRLLGLFGGTACRVTYPNGDRVEYMVALFGCEIDAGATPRPWEDETESLRFYPVAEIPALGVKYPRELLAPGAPGLPVDRSVPAPS